MVLVMSGWREGNGGKAFMGCCWRGIMEGSVGCASRLCVKAEVMTWREVMTLFHLLLISLQLAHIDRRFFSVHFGLCSTSVLFGSRLSPYAQQHGQRWISIGAPLLFSWLEIKEEGEGIEPDELGLKRGQKVVALGAVVEDAVDRGLQVTLRELIYA